MATPPDAAAPLALDTTAVRLVIFDLDGTLVDSSEVIIETLYEVAALEGLDVPSRQWASDRIGFPPRETFELLGAPDPAAAHDRFRERVVPRLPERTRVLDGVPDALAVLADAGLAMAVATSRTTRGALESLVHLGLAGSFACVAGRDEVASPKPAPDLLRWVLERTGHGPGQALMVGDTTADADSARAAGMACWGVLGGHGTESALRAAGAERILAGVAELPRALGRTP